MQSSKRRRSWGESVGARVASRRRVGPIIRSYLGRTGRRSGKYRHNPFGRYGSTVPFSLQGSSVGRKLTYFGPQVLPDRYYTNFRYTTVEADTTAGGISEYIYRGNSLYDPDAAVGGTAAMGYDRFIYFYNKFRTDASSIHVTLLNIDADDPVYVSVFPSINSGAECATLHDCIDSLLWPHSKHAIATLQGGEAGVGNYGKTKNLVARETPDRDLCHDVSNNPTLCWYWHVVFFTHNTANALNLQFNVAIKYWSECYQPRLQYYHQASW